jgi:hypothetical protein
MPITRQLHAASLPFVTRALRGGHRGRYAAIAVLLALLSVVLGGWLALGSGDFEREVRVGLGLEASKDTQEREGFLLFAEDEHEASALRSRISEHATPANLTRILNGELVAHYNLEVRITASIRYGLVALASVENGSRVLHNYREPARALLRDISPYALERLHNEWGFMGDRVTPAQLDSIITRQLQPAVVLYRSPLAFADAVKLTGLIAGGLTLLLLMIYGPVLAGTQMAQEVHENTLQPLTGTALSARELVLGLSLGPAAVVALLAAPQIILFLAAAIAVGHVLPALALLLVGLVGGAFLTLLAQLAGFALGGTRTPGILGVVMLALLAPLSLFGFVFGLDLPRAGLGVLALIPQAAAGHALFETFLPAGASLRAQDITAVDLASAEVSVALGTLGMLCFAYLGLRALERRVGELAPAALRRTEALVGAVVSIALVLLANPLRGHGYDPAGFYFGNLALVLVPLAILLMMRVPLGDTPPALRRVPFAGLLGEFAVGVGLYLGVVAGMIGTRRIDVMLNPVGLVYLTWMVAVVGLLAIRVVALPMTLLAKVWAGVCSIGVAVAFVHVVEWGRGDHRPASSAVLLWDASPLLGVLQLVLMVLIPVMLVRALQNRGRLAAAPE